jgi:hypothetical protein
MSGLAGFGCVMPDSDSSPAKDVTVTSLTLRRSLLGIVGSEVVDSRAARETHLRRSVNLHVQRRAEVFGVASCRS